MNWKWKWLKVEVYYSFLHPLFHRQEHDGTPWADKPKEITQSGFKMELDNTSIQDKGYWEQSNHAGIAPPMTSYMKENLKQGMTFIDGGANSGYFTMLASTLVGEKGTVYAFEPAERAYKRLCRNIELNRFKNIVPIKKALGSAGGTARLFIGEGGDGGNTLLGGMPEMSGKFEDVEVITLDSLNIKPDMLKLDLEGYEAEALKGSMATLQRHKPIVMFEFNYDTLFKKDGQFNQAFDALRLAGYGDFTDMNSWQKVQSYLELSYGLTDVAARQ